MQEVVPFQSGCIAAVRPIHELVHNENALRLSPGQSLKQWAEQRVGEPYAGYDIAGGGWPNLLVKGGGYHDLLDLDYASTGRVEIHPPEFNRSRLPATRQWDDRPMAQR